MDWIKVFVISFFISYWLRRIFIITIHYFSSLQKRFLYKIRHFNWKHFIELILILIIISEGKKSYDNASKWKLFYVRPYNKWNKLIRSNQLKDKGLLRNSLSIFDVKSEMEVDCFLYYITTKCWHKNILLFHRFILFHLWNS